MKWTSKYGVEFWDKAGNRLVDFSGRAYNRKIIQSRNRPDEIRFSLDLNDFEAYCKKLHVDPNDILQEGRMEVRIKRLGTYISGGQLVYCDRAITQAGLRIDCIVYGFLWLFGSRFTGESPAGLVSEVHTSEAGTAKSRTDLAWYLIDATQSLTNGDFGITRGLTGGSTTPYDKQYGRTQIREALQSLTEIETDPIDIEFAPDKVFNTYAEIGSLRSDISFTYPGNILTLSAPRDATDIANEVLGLGSGAEDGTRLMVPAVDSASQLNYELRQKKVQTDGTDNSDNGITDAAEAVLAAKKAPMRVPSFTVDGSRPPFVTDYGIGDRIPIRVRNHPVFADVNGIYRVEKRTIDIDDNDTEVVTPEVVAWV